MKEIIINEHNLEDKDIDSVVRRAKLVVENSKGEFLFEKNNKKVGFPYVPVGGHITSGETPRETIIRAAKVPKAILRLFSALK